MPSLDPTDRSKLRSLGHRMLDDMFDHLGGLRDRPVWQPMPESLRQQLCTRLTRAPSTAGDVYERFRRLVLPYATGNLHPAERQPRWRRPCADRGGTRGHRLARGDVGFSA
jgi:aromatic-L-amino-acid/L-tryptophan decarboxylase